MAVRGDPQDCDHRAAHEVAARTKINSHPELNNRPKLLCGRTRGGVRKIGSAAAVSKGPRTLAGAPTTSVASGVLRRLELARSRERNGRLDRQCPSTLRAREKASTRVVESRGT